MWDLDVHLLIFTPEFFPSFALFLQGASFKLSSVLRGAYTFPGTLLGEPPATLWGWSPCVNGALIRWFSIYIDCIIQLSLGHKANSRGAH